MEERRREVTEQLLDVEGLESMAWWQFCEASTASGAGGVGGNGFVIVITYINYGFKYKAATRRPL